MPITNTELCLEFLPNPAGEEEGLGHAGIQTYRNDPLAGATRETGQNSRDAGESLPVRIAYDVLEIPCSDIPAMDTLRSVVNICLKQSVGKEKETAFFQQASKVVSQKSIQVLRISDFNTFGAKGPSVSGTPFHSLVKGSGVSVKENAASGGSFGIGKNAVFAVSDLQMVFYATLYEEQGKKRFLAQGKIILIAHQGEDGTSKRQVGYWGLPDFREVSDSETVPSWLRRTEIGTSVYVFGFRDTSDWQKKITYSLIQNFFPAIHKSEMEFSLDGKKYHIGSLALPSLFKDPQLRATAKVNDREYEFDTSASLYRCLTSSEAKEEIIENPVLGKVQVRVLVEEGLPKKIVIVRNGMLITDNLEHFGDRFSRFPMFKDFVAVVTPLEAKGSAFIKRLEDPRHTELSAEGLPDASTREYAKKVMKALAKEIRRIVRENAVTSFDAEVSADEMRRFFAAESTVSSQNNPSQNEDPQKIRYTIEPQREKRSFRASDSGSDGNSGGFGEDGPGQASKSAGKGGPPNPDPQHTQGGRGDSGKARTIPLLDVRNVRSAAGNAKLRTLFFTPTYSGKVDIRLQAVGLNETDDLPILSASSSQIADGKARREVVANERIRIDLEFEDEYDGPIDIVVSTIRESRGDADEA